MARDNHAAVNDSRKLKGFTAELYEWLEAISFALAIVVLLFTFVFRVVMVSGRSMQTTLENGDRLLVNTLFYEPEVGDVVIIIQDNEVTSEPIVKRIIALEGDEVKYDNSTGKLWVNGVEQDESAYVDSDRISSTIPSGYDMFAEWETLTVPEGCVFVMGDNRSGSTDSRDKRIGFIQEENILGKVILRIYPMDSIGAIRG